MKKKANFLVYSIIAGLVIYLLDSVVFYLDFSKDYSFIEAFLTKVPFWELIERFLILTSFIILGLILTMRIGKNIQKSSNYEGKVFQVPHGKLNFNFLSSLSYQIRTPLNAIIGFSELLKSPNLSPESKAIYINNVNSSSKYLLLLINNLSEISKIESNELTIIKSATNINSIISDLFDFFKSRQEELAKPELKLVIDQIRLSETFYVLTDPERFKHVLHNLLENAIINTDSGAINIGYSSKKEGKLEFYIKDSGRGFSQERLDTIFARYNKLTDNENMPFDGSVLRLAISKSIVKLLGGEIWADSKVGQGTIIYFSIPFEQSKLVPKSTTKKEEKSAPIVRNWSDRYILISEDVESNYIYLEELLRSTKINILWAKNGIEAVEFVRSNPKIELVLMDILMPEMDGYQASKEIKSLRKNLPIVAQTACMIEGNEENAKNFDSYLTKPIWAPQLFASIEKYIH